ncbi:hypothetical protein [Aeromonas sp.]|uniref:DUF4160 domain-containing protein n=1 Tax=bacterium 19CA06SA08-2 TaxID=2920658 RepID=A0AAU6UA03_UNCXX
MPKESFYPDHKEPHVHLHKGGATFTDVGHNHRTLQNGSVLYRGVVREVIADLQTRGDDRSRELATYIHRNFS